MKCLSGNSNADNKTEHYRNAEVDRDAGIFHKITDGEFFKFVSCVSGKTGSLLNTLT